MKYEESNLVELKRMLDDDMKSEIVSFLNSYIGGTIYVGVDDNGTIYPNCSDYVKFHYNKDGVFEINIESGKEKPYYIKSKGLKPNGVYIRYGRNKSQATQQEIARMVRERDDIPYESLVSRNQDLTFITLKNKFEEKEMDFEDFKPVTSGFMIDGKYTNVAYWFSDQYQVETKMAVYQGLSRNIFRSKKEYDGSIISQIDHALDYFDLCNEIRVVINGDPTRKEIPSYKKRAAREAILNCYCHRDFSRRSNIKIEFFDDRLEILSPGGFYDGLTLEKALNGEQSFRNEYVVRLLYKLGYIENYASGLTRIFDEYAYELDEPQIITNDTSFKVVLPNKNYYALYKHPQNHIKDNNVEYDISGLFHKEE